VPFQSNPFKGFFLALLCLAAPAAANGPIGVIVGIEGQTRAGAAPTNGNGSTTYNLPMFLSPPNSGAQYPNTAQGWFDDIVEQVYSAGVDYMSITDRGWLPADNPDAGDTRLYANFLTGMKDRGLQGAFKFADFVDTPASWTARRNLDQGDGYGYTPLFDMGNTANAYYIWNTDLETFFQTVPADQLYEINGRPLLYFWSIGDAFCTNQANGNSKAVLMMIRANCQSEFGMDPFIVVDGSWIQADPACNDPAVIDGVDDWFDMPDKGETLAAFNGSTIGCVVPAFSIVNATTDMFIDPLHGQQYADNLSATVGQNALVTLQEGFTDWMENCSTWRSTDTTYYDYPNQRLDICRSFTKNAFAQSFRVHAAACDSYSAPQNLSNSGGVYRAGTLDCEVSNDAGGGWDVFNCQAGNWLYWVRLPVPGGSAFELRYAAASAAQVRFTVDAQAGGVLSLPATGGARNWATVQDSSFSFLANGYHGVTLTVLSGTCSLNYFDIDQVSTPTNTPTATITPTFTPTATATATCPAASCCAAPSSLISTVAGDGSGPSAQFQGDGGPATSAPVGQPMGVCGDSAGNLYVSEPYNFYVRKVNAAGTISTIVGDGACDNGGDGGPGTAATICNVGCLRLDSFNNLYMVDFVGYHNQVRVLNPAGLISTFAGGNSSAGFGGDGGPARAAQLSAPRGLAIDASNNVYIADTGNHRVRMVNASTGIISTVAGNGTAGYAGDGGQALSAELNGPYGLAVSGSSLYIADTGNNRVRMVNLSSGVISTLAGNGTAGFSGDNGPGASAELSSPYALALDHCGHLLIADFGNARVRQLALGTGTINTLAGAGAGFGGDSGAASAAKLNGPADLYFNACTGNLYIAEQYNNRVRMISANCTPTPTPSLTLTLTLTGTATCTRTATLSGTPSASPSQTRTGTPTPTPSSTGTRTGSPSPTASLSPSRTVTQTCTVSPSATLTDSPTLSVTESATSSPTITRTPTGTATVTPEPSVTATVSRQATSTPSGTVTPTLSVTASATQTVTLTPTQTVTLTPTQTVTLTPTQTVTLTQTQTGTGTPTQTVTLTVTLSQSGTFTLTQSMTASPTETATATPSPTLSRTSSATPANSPTSSPKSTETETPSPTILPTATKAATPPSGQENGQVLSAQAVPNPQSGPDFVFKVELSGPSALIQARIYTRGMDLVAQAAFDGVWTEGWNTLEWTLPALADGVYYVEFSAGAATTGARGKVVKLLILR
jgi:hypothetical protein